MQQERCSVVVESINRESEVAVVSLGDETYIVPVCHWVDADGDECGPYDAVVAVGGPLWPDEDRGYFVICDLDEFVPMRLC